MNKSEEIGLLALALSQLQGEIKDAVKDKKGYGYNYADLSSVLDIARPLLTKYKLSITQLPGAVGEKMSLTTMLMHESGQWISSTMEMPVEKGKGMTLAQATGSVMTYARRYALAAIVGIAQTDNDACIEQPKNSHKEEYISDDQVIYLTDKIQEAGLKESDILNRLKIGCLDEIKLRDFPSIDKKLEATILAKQQVSLKPSGDTGESVKKA